MNLYLKTLAGLEPLAAEELKTAGATAIVPGRRGISFEGDAASPGHDGGRSRRFQFFGRQRLETCEGFEVEVHPPFRLVW